MNLQCHFHERLETLLFLLIKTFLRYVPYFLIENLSTKIGWIGKRKVFFYNYTPKDQPAYTVANFCMLFKWSAC